VKFLEKLTKECATVLKTARPERPRGFESHLLLQREIELFWRKVDWSDGCWLWKAGRSGRMQYGSHRIKRIRRTFQAHRLAWAIAFGSLPDEINVLHKCDTPLCCNPEHLFLGTIADNNADRDAKGRTRPAKCDDNGNSKLSRAEVDYIRKNYIKGSGPWSTGNSLDLAVRFGVSQKTIRDCANGLFYRDWLNQSSRGEVLNAESCNLSIRG
jgi:hypothetical protein